MQYYTLLKQNLVVGFAAMTHMFDEVTVRREILDTGAIRITQQDLRAVMPEDDPATIRATECF